jgi:2-phosphosulfolactate phosphatase
MVPHRAKRILAEDAAPCGVFMKLSVTYTPAEFESRDVAGATVVGIDCLRASTSIVAALMAGAKAVYPFLTVEEALAFHAGRPRAILGGERGGVRIDGFDLGNSPREYTPETVGGREVIMTTTNGTRLLASASRADRIFVAGFVNAAATARALIGFNGEVVLAAAGTEGYFSAEDALAAGLIADVLVRRGDAEPDDSALFARLAYAGAACNLRAAVDAGRGARNVRSIGLDEDIAFSLALDSLPVVAIVEKDPLRVVAGRTPLEKLI